MIPTKETRERWRTLAENTDMVSAVGEYAPEEFIVLLDAVDELEAEVEQLKSHNNLPDHNYSDKGIFCAHCGRLITPAA